jgi:hypothetical protein
MKVRSYQSGAVIFVEEKVKVILNGNVVLRNHSADLEAGKLLAHFTEGDILGSNQEKFDRKMTVYPDNWLMTTSPTEVIEMEKSEFEQLLKLQGTDDDKTALMNISNHSLFKNISLASLYMLYFEGIKIQSFRPGDLIMKMAPRSALNTPYE